MIDMDDEVAGRQPLEDVPRDDPAKSAWPPDTDRPEQLPVGDEGESVRTTDETAVEAPIDERDRAGRRCLPDPTDDPDRMIGLREQVGEARRLVRGEHDPLPVLDPAVDGLDEAT